MLKNICKLEVKVNDKFYQLLCDNDSPIEHLKEAVNQFMKFVFHIEDQVKAQQEAQAQSSVVEEQKIEELKAE